MAHDYPEGDDAKETDSAQRALVKIVSLLGGGGSAGAGPPDASTVGWLYRDTTALKLYIKFEDDWYSAFNVT